MNKWIIEDWAFVVEVIDDEVKEVQFIGGCPGNHLGIAAPVKGMKITDVINRLEGITCGPRSSSCPDQLACALKEYQKKVKDFRL